MRKIDCPNCASNNFESIGWDKYICMYCGTVVEESEGNFLEMKITTVPIKTYKVRTVVGMELLRYGEDAFDKYVKQQLALDIAKSICNDIKFDYEHDPHRMESHYYGKIGVAQL